MFFYIFNKSLENIYFAENPVLIPNLIPKSFSKKR